MEEIGLAALSPHNPLMSFHTFHDHGVSVKVSETNSDQKRIPMLAPTNYPLDAAKQNRAIVVFHGDSTAEDLAETAKSILLTALRQKPADYSLSAISAKLQHLATQFSHILQRPGINWLIGRRDFFGLVSFLQRQLSTSVDTIISPGRRAQSRSGLFIY